MNAVSWYDLRISPIWDCSRTLLVRRFRTRGRTRWQTPLCVPPVTEESIRDEVRWDVQAGSTFFIAHTFLTHHVSRVFLHVTRIYKVRDSVRCNEHSLCPEMVEMRIFKHCSALMYTDYIKIRHWGLKNNVVTATHLGGVEGGLQGDADGTPEVYTADDTQHDPLLPGESLGTHAGWLHPQRLCPQCVLRSCPALWLSPECHMLITHLACSHTQFEQVRRLTKVEVCTVTRCHDRSQDRGLDLNAAVIVSIYCAQPHWRCFQFPLRIRQ
jgi:hypothetical protein